MLARNAPLRFPCGADFSKMTAKDARRRLCAECDTVVHDLSAMQEGEASALLASTEGRLCIRYLYDAKSGEIAFAQTPVIPARSLARNARRVLTAAALAAPAILLEACGGADGGDYYREDAGSHANARPTVKGDASVVDEDEEKDASNDARSDAKTRDSAADPADAGSDANEPSAASDIAPR